jgi:pimeloyl-ACP methyl ester carboxylesterase
MVIIIVLFVIITIPVVGLFNYYIRQQKAKKTEVSWFNPDNLEKINHINTHILIKGEGEPLLFIHGSQMNLYDFRYNIDFFSKHFKVYAFDMVGCGFTDKPKADYSPVYFAEFIREVMLHYNIKRASFIASSWGGGHVFYFALKYPDMVNKLVMSSPCGYKHKMLSSYDLLSIPVIGSLALLYSNRGIVRNELLKAFHDKSFVDEDLVNAVYLPFYTKGCINSTVKSARNDDFSFVEKNLEEIEAPVLLIWGSSDQVHQKWMMDKMKERIRNSEIIIFEKVGHLPHEEVFDEFNRHALEFLLKDSKEAGNERDYSILLK